MAYSATVNYKGVVGNVRMVILSCVADGATGDISGGGIGFLYAAQISPVSMTTANSVAYVRVKINALSAGTAAVGSVGFSGLVSGDAFFVTMFGRS